MSVKFIVPSNGNRSEDSLMHYGVPGMKWGRRKNTFAPQKEKGRQPSWQRQKSDREKRWIDDNGINPHRPNGTKSRVDAVLEKNINKTLSKARSTAIKKSAKSGKKKTNKVLSKAGQKTVKSVGKSAKLGLSVLQAMYNMSDTAAENREMATYLNLAANMSPEYRRRFMYEY